MDAPMTRGVYLEWSPCPCDRAEHVIGGWSHTRNWLAPIPSVWRDGEAWICEIRKPSPGMRGRTVARREFASRDEAMAWGAREVGATEEVDDD